MKKTQARVARALRALALLVLGGGYLVGCSHHGGSSLRALAAADGKLTDGALTTSEKVSTAPKEAGKITLYKNNEPQSGNPSSVFEALDIISKQTGSDVWTIELEPGTYKETKQLTYNGSATIKISGKNKTPYGLDVLIKGVGDKDNYNVESSRSMFEIRGSGDTILEYVMMEHEDMMTDFWYTGDDKEQHNATQREVIGHQSRGTLAAYNCSFISRQDTIRTESKAWFYKCYIEGDVDFLWIEQSTTESKVALYEECILRAMSDRKDTVYFTAPRLPVKNDVWKGLVIWNSRLEAEENLKKVYLGRNPWNEQKDKEDGTSYFKTFYENVAIVNTKLYGKALEEAIWASGAHGTDDQRFVGFKTDSHFRKPSSGLGAIIGPDIVRAEYAGRNNILNRYYDIAAGVFKEDATAYWDVTAVIEENGWDAAEDTSGSLGEGETKVNSVVYTFSKRGASDDVDVTSSTDDMSGISISSGLKWHDDTHGAKFTSQATITLTLTEPSVITLKACNYNNGTIATTGVRQKTVKGDSTNDSDEMSILYTGNGGTLEIAFTGTVYLHDKIVVKTLTNEENKVVSVAISGNTLIAPSEETTLTANVKSAYLNDMSGSTVSWSSSTPSVATVTNGGVVRGVATGTATITASCGGKSGTILVEVDGSDVVSRDTFFDLRTLFSGLSTGGSSSTGSIGKLSYSAMYYKDSQHGAYFINTSTLSFKVRGACTIYLGKDQYNGATYTVSDGVNSSVLQASSGTLDTKVTEDMSGDTDNPSFKYTGNSEATITISVTGGSGQNYLPAIQVKF